MKNVKRLLSLILVLVMCAGLLSTFASAAVVKNGSSGTEVRRVQYNLNILGFNCGTADGICGNKTVSAIRNYQSSRGLAVDGMAGPATQEALKNEVIQIQQLLKNHGCYNDSIDGIAGPNTIAGLKKFQSNNNIKPANGVINSATMKALNNTPSTPAKSTLKIGSGSYDPGTLMLGSSYSINGKITSNYKITSVTVGIYNSNGSATSQVKTVKPNATSYNINGVDNNIKFGTLNAGTYYFKVTAKDASGTELKLVDRKFTVKKPDGNFAWPLPGVTYISSYFKGRIHPIYGTKQNHSGIDIPASKGVSVKAAGDGTAYVGCNSCSHNYGKNYSCGCGGGYGNYVYIVHSNGMRSFYAHLTAVSVKNGQYVSKGTKIGTVGSTGSSTGNHLHFEMRTGSGTSSRVDPLNYVTPK